MRRPRSWRVVWRVAKWTLGIFAVLLGTLVALGYIYREDIERLAANELLKFLDADIAIQRIELSFWNSWPEVSVELHGVTALTTEANMARHQYRKRSILEAEQLGFKLDLLSFFTENYEVRRIVLIKPIIYVEANAQDRWNWETMLAPVLEQDTTVPDTGRVSFALRHFELQDARIRVLQPNQRLTVDAQAINLSLAGDFTAEQYQIETELSCLLDTLAQNRERLVTHRNLKFEGAFDVNDAQHSYRLQGAKLWIEEIFLALHGQVIAPGRGQGLHLDIAFSSGESDYRRVLSLLPPSLTTDLRDLEVGGHFQLEGTLVGLANRTQAPTLLVDYRVWDGSLKTTDPPAAISDLSFRGQLEWNAKKLEQARITIDSLTGRLGNEPFRGSFSYANFADPSIRLGLKGTIDLEELTKLWPDALTEYALTGRVAADFQTEGRLADFRGAGLQRTNSTGELVLENIGIGIQGLPRALRNLSGRLAFSQTTLNVNDIQGLWGAAPVRLSGSIVRFIPYLFEDNTHLGLNLMVSLDSLNLNEFASASGTGGGQASPNAAATDAINRIDLSASLAIKHLRLAQMEATNVTAQAAYQNRTLNVSHLKLKALGGTAEFAGVLAPALWQGNVTLVGMDVHRFFQAFPDFGELLLVGQNAYGFLTTTFSFHGKPLPNLTLDPASLVMAGSASIADGKILDFKVLEEMSSFIRLRQFRNLAFGACSTGFSLENSKVTISGLFLQANGYQLWADGTHGFDQTLDYQLKIQMPRRQWAESQNAEVQQWIETVDNRPREGIKLFIRITGTVDNPRFQLDGQELRQEIRRDFQREAQELEAEAVQERERIFGTQSTEDATDWIEEQPRERRPLFNRRQRDSTQRRRN